MKSLFYFLFSFLFTFLPGVHAQSPASSVGSSKGPITWVFPDLAGIHKWDNSNGDSWDPFWADDGELYAFNCDGRGFGTAQRNLAFHKLAGASLPDLVGSLVNPMDEYGKANQKERDNATWKACGQECIDSVFYAFVSRNVYGKDSKDPEMRQTAFNSSLIKSTDKGRTWTPTAKENYEHPMWPGPRFGAPFFFHYGQNGGSVTQDQADKYVYAISPNGFWNDGDDYVVGRVLRTKLPELRAADWSYFTGGSGQDEKSWSEKIEAAKPVLALKSKCGQTGPCYIPALKTYLLVAWYNPVRLKKWYGPTEMIYEFYQAPHPWGPWGYINSMTDKHISPGSNMYGPSICAKFQEQDGKNVRVWMFTSGCQFEDKPTGLYKAWAIPLILGTTPEPKSTLVNDNDPAVRYTGTWTYSAGRKSFDHKADVHQTSEAGAAAELAFNGTGVALIGGKESGAGNVDVWIDGVFKRNVNLASVNFPALAQVVLFDARDLPNGRHVIKIVNKEQTPVTVDAFRVYGSGQLPDKTR